AIPDRSSDRIHFTRNTSITDALGRWTTENLPASLLENIAIRVEHSGFARTNLMPNLEIAEQLRKREFTIVLARGAELSGVVTDQAGRPVSGATVAFGQRFFSNRQETTTDES